MHPLSQECEVELSCMEEQSKCRVQPAPVRVNTVGHKASWTVPALAAHRMRIAETSR
jgi:hypothetical protein